jgi:hypothetical protein
MPFGVLRVVNCDILWLDLNGRFRELSELTWRTLDREQGYARSRQHHGLCAHLPEASNKHVNGRQRVLTTPALPLTLPSTDQEREAHASARKALLADLRRQISGHVDPPASCR